MSAFDFGHVAVQDPSVKASGRMSKLESKVFVDPPLEEYPEIVFHKARQDSEMDDVLNSHPEPKQPAANFDFDMSVAPLIGGAQQQDQGNFDFNNDLFQFAVDESARGAKPPEAEDS